LYWGALGAWFQQDDFAWLSIFGRSGGPAADWRTLLFAPMAGGLVRPLNERLFFMVFAPTLRPKCISFSCCRGRNRIRECDDNVNGNHVTEEKHLRFLIQRNFCSVPAGYPDTKPDFATRAP
jgi:hypothetical protein